MTDYSELVKALRMCASGNCHECGRYDLECEDNMRRDAAAAIEELEATIELMKLNMPDFFPDTNKVTLPKMEVQDG